jgi:hypothetical protein
MNGMLAITAGLLIIGGMLGILTGRDDKRRERHAGVANPLVNCGPILRGDLPAHPAGSGM